MSEAEELAALRALKSAKDTGNGRSELEALRSLKAISINQSAAEPIIPDESAAEAFVISAGKGMVSGARGAETLLNQALDFAGMDRAAQLAQLDSEREEERRLFAPLEEKHPIATTLGEITGGVAATAPIGGVAGIAAKGAAGAAGLGATAMRFAPSVAAGVTEGSIIGADEGQTAEGAVLGGASAAAAEALLPPIAKRLKRYFGRAKPLDELVDVVDGQVTPTDETVSVLDELGLQFSDIAKEAQEEILTPSQAATKAAFKAEGIDPASRTRIRKTVADTQREGFLLRQSDGDAANEFRDSVVRENESIKARFGQLADELGVSGESGGAGVKDALFNIQSNMRSLRNKAYDDLAKISQQNPQIVSKIPVNKVRLMDGIQEAADLPLGDAPQNSIVRAFEDFGLIEKQSKQGGLSLITGEVEPQQLTIANLSDFRKRINNALDQAVPAEAKARKSIISAIDDMELEVVDAFEGATLQVPKQIQEAAKRARESVIREKRAFDAADLVNNLIKPKRAGLNAKESPLTAASKVFDKVSTKATTNEDVRKLTGMLLSDSSDESLEALGNLQASSIMNILESSISPSRRISDASGNAVEIISGANVKKAINKIGRDKINSIFKNNPDAMNSLKRLERISESLITPDEAIQKGSIPPDVLNKLINSVIATRRAPLGLGVVGDIASAGKGAAMKRKVQTFGASKDDLIDFVIFEDSPRLKALLNPVLETAAQAPAVSAAQLGTDRGNQ